MLKPLAFAAILAAAVPATALAETGVMAFGPRVGFSVDPDQVVFGGHMMIGELAPHLTFDPSLEVGFGDDVTVIALNFDLHYHTIIRDSDWTPYFGAGFAVQFIEVDLPAPFEDVSDTEVNGALIAGVSVPTGGNQFFGELKLAFDDPNLKLMVGWNFGRP